MSKVNLFTSSFQNSGRFRLRRLKRVDRKDDMCRPIADPWPLTHQNKMPVKNIKYDITLGIPCFQQSGAILASR